MTKQIFTFASNEAGVHGAGAAKYAHEQKGAVYGHSYGLAGDSFAIPTKDNRIQTLPIANISAYIQGFKAFAYGMQGRRTFKVTRIGCGLAKLDDSIIAPLFIGSPLNCKFDSNWKPFLGEQYTYWGHQ